jgi:heme/copper-type cytochrome/quinol oxidase subunit 2
MMFSSSQGNVEVNGFKDVLYVSNAFSPTSTQNDEHNHWLILILIFIIIIVKLILKLILLLLVINIM